eukprot:jgi/Chlat1/3031/Chrsp206S03285
MATKLLPGMPAWLWPLLAALSDMLSDKLSPPTVLSQASLLDMPATELLDKLRNSFQVQLGDQSQAYPALHDLMDNLTLTTTLVGEAAFVSIVERLGDTVVGEQAEEGKGEAQDVQDEPDTITVQAEVEGEPAGSPFTAQAEVYESQISCNAFLSGCPQSKFAMLSCTHIRMKSWRRVKGRCKLSKLSLLPSLQKLRCGRQYWCTATMFVRPNVMAMIVKGLRDDCSVFKQAVKGVEGEPAGSVTAQAEVPSSALISRFERLGAGSFATVFCNKDYSAVVVKQVRHQADATKLLQEYKDLELLAAACSKQEHLIFQVPQPLGYYDTFQDFANALGNPPGMALGLPPVAMYVMQRMRPVPLEVGNAIMEKYFPEAEKEKPMPPFLARLYLGKETSQARSRFFNLENYPLTTDRIEGLGLPASRIAAGMGQLLSFINFEVGWDGRDIEFVLCSDPNNPMSQEPWYGCIDFNQMRAHNDDVHVIVQSITINDPYYPRPASPYWKAFSGAYLTGALNISPEAGELATSVLQELEKHWSRLL